MKAYFRPQNNLTKHIITLISELKKETRGVK